MKIEETYTSQEAAEEVGVSDSRIRQLALAGEIEHRYFGRLLMITETGINQAKERKTKPGPPKKKARREAA